MLQYDGERQVQEYFNKVDLDHRQRYLFAASLVSPGMKIADVGCGIGYGSFLLSCITPCQKVVGFDISQQAVEYAKRYYQKNAERIVFECRNILHDIKKEEYDLVTALEVIEHIDNPIEFISAIREMMKPDGLTIVSTPNQNVLKYDREVFTFHKRHYTPKEFETILTDCGLEVIFWGSQNTSVVYAFTGNATNVFVCRKKGSKVAFPVTVDCIPDTAIGRMMANYDLGGYCMDYLPHATKNSVLEVWEPAKITKESIGEELRVRTDHNRRRFYPETFGDQPNFTDVTEKLKSGDKIEMEFQAIQNGLFQISVMPATYMNVFEGSIRFTLYSKEKECLACWNVENNVSKIYVKNGELLDFRFKNQKHSLRKKYKLLIEILEIKENAKLSLYYNKNNDDGKFYINGQCISHPLTYRLYYDA